MRWLRERREKREAEALAAAKRTEDAWMAFWAAMHQAQRGIRDGASSNG